MSEENGFLKFITCGNVDDGKPTLIRHALYDSKLLYVDQEQVFLLDSQVGSRGGTTGYSPLLDGLMAERKQGIMIGVACRYFTMNRHSFIVADIPGHEKYTRNMTVGASSANLVAILVDVFQGVLVQTCRHARICVLTGIRYFVSAVSRMGLIEYDPKHFFEILKELETFRTELDLEHTVSIPVSATEGDNVTCHSEKMPWHQGETLLGHLRSMDVPADAPGIGFYPPVQRVCRSDHTFRGFQGQIEVGRVSVGDTLTTLPSGELVMIKSIHIVDQEVESAVLGQSVTTQLDREVDVSRGCVLARGTNLKTTKSFSATLLWMGDQELIPGKDCWIKLSIKLLPTIVTGIRHKVDVNSGELPPAYPVKKNEIARCKVVLSEPMVPDEFRLHRTTGELILIDRVNRTTATCGMIESVGDQKKDDVYLHNGSEQLKVNLFDRFYYYPNIHTILRYSPSPVVYVREDALPLQSEAFDYPADLDLAADSGFVNTHDGASTGFGPCESRLPLLGVNGIESEAKLPYNLGKYRRVTAWEKDYEI